MTWGEFHTTVMSLLGDHAEDVNPVKIRQIDQAIRAACMKMQQVIPGYRTGHETIFEPEDLTEECFTHRGDLPDGADLKEVWLYGALDEEAEDPACVRMRAKPDVIDWADRMKLITGLYRGLLAWTLDPHGNRFYIAPKLEEGEELRLIWNGVKLNFDEDDKLPWGEEATEPVSHFVNAQLERKARDKINNYESFMGDWQRGLALLDTTEAQRRTTE